MTCNFLVRFERTQRASDKPRNVNPLLPNSNPVMPKNGVLPQSGGTWVSSSSGTGNAKAFSFLNTRSDFLLWW